MCIRDRFDCERTEVLESLIALKRNRYQRSNTFDILSVGWAADLLRELHNVRLPEFQGMLSAYWAGDKLIGAHFGMLTGDTLHYWFPVYDKAYQRYSPGTELLLQSAEHASERGVTKLDLGYGDDDYKFKFCNAGDKVSCGVIDFNPVTQNLERARFVVRKQLKQLPMKPTAKRLLRKVFPGFGKWNFR